MRTLIILTVILACISKSYCQSLKVAEYTTNGDEVFTIYQNKDSLYSIENSTPSTNLLGYNTVYLKVEDSFNIRCEAVQLLFTYKGKISFIEFPLTKNSCARPILQVGEELIMLKEVFRYKE